MKLKFFYRPLAWHPAQGTGFDLSRTATAADAAAAADHPNKGRYNLFLAAMLQSDFQDADYCERVLADMLLVERGKKEWTDCSGNCCTATIRLSVVQIDYDIFDWYDLPEGRFTYSEFKTALQGWRDFLEMPVSMDSSVEIEV